MFKKGYRAWDFNFFFGVLLLLVYLTGVVKPYVKDQWVILAIAAVYLLGGFFKGSLYKMVFGKKTAPKVTASPAQEYVVCPNCGAGYNTEMVANSIFLTSPFMADMQSWSTRVTCKNCRNEIWVTGSYRKVFGQPRS